MPDSIRKGTILIVAFVGFVASLIGIYSYFFATDRHIELQYEIVASTNVLDINADINKLDVLYDGQSLKASSSNLKIFTIRLSNLSDRSVLINQYDDNDLLGLGIENGQIIDVPTILATSNEYLKQNLSLSLVTSQEIRFSKVIIGGGESFVFKALVLHSLNSHPKVFPVGMVADVEDIQVISMPDSGSARPAWLRAIEGNIPIQLLRALFYTVVTAVVLVAATFLVTLCADQYVKFKRGRNINEFKKTKGYYYAKTDDAIFARYQKEGINALGEYLDFARDSSRIKGAYIELQSVKESSGRFTIFKPAWQLFAELRSDGLITVNGDVPGVNHNMLRTLKALVKFLEGKGEKAFSRGNFVVSSEASIDDRPLF